LNLSGPPKRGGCTFFEKAKRAVGAGALGLVIVNFDDTLPMNRSGVTQTGSGQDDPVEIPVVFIKANDFERLLAAGNSTCLVPNKLHVLKTLLFLQDSYKWKEILGLDMTGKEISSVPFNCTDKPCLLPRS
jgi:hypothetical protein